MVGDKDMISVSGCFDICVCMFRKPFIVFKEQDHNRNLPKDGIARYGECSGKVLSRGHVSEGLPMHIGSKWE
jgi:hypothetical protein